MRITELRAENIKRVKLIEITPDGDVVIIGGGNGEGKTSLLDSMDMALRGGRSICDEPVRKGATKGKVTVMLGDDLVVTRTFTKAGTQLVVSNAKGVSLPSPQAILSNLYGTLTFDPLAFVRMKPDVQREALRDLLGLDFSELDAQRTRDYDERAAVNREAKQLEGQLAGLLGYADAPAEEVKVSDLLAEIEQAQETNQHNASLRQELATGQQDISRMKKHLSELEAEVEMLQDRIAIGKKQIAASQKDMAPIVQQVEALADVDTAPLQEKASSAEDTNRKVRENIAHAEIAKMLKDKRAASSKFTRAMDDIDEDKAKQLAEATMPVEGLSFDESQVLFGGIPFSQASSAEQLRVSVAMAAAGNPDLRVMLIRDGSLLDPDSLKLISEFATDNDYQIWIERVGEGDECQVIIEDGQVKGAQAPEEEDEDDEDDDS